MKALIAILMLVPALAFGQIESKSIIQTTNPPLQVSIEGDHVLTVTKLPVTFTVPEGFAYYDWDMDAPVRFKKSKQLNRYTITEAPDGDYVLHVAVLSIDFDEDKVNTQASKIQFRIKAEPGSDDGPEDPGDEEPQPGSIASVAQAQAEAVIEDHPFAAVTSVAMAEAYESAAEQIENSMTAAEAIEIAKGKASLVRQTRPNFDANWRPALEAIWKEIVRVGGDKTAKAYRASILEMAKGLRKAGGQ